MTDLTKQQQNLYNQLEEAITNRQDVTDLLKGASKDDLLKVLTTTNIIRVNLDSQYGTKYAFTLLGYAIHCNNQKSVQAILTAAKEQDILEAVLATEVIQDETILEIAKEYGVLEEVLAIKKEKGQVPSSKLGVQDLSKVVNDVRQAH